MHLFKDRATRQITGEVGMFVRLSYLRKYFAIITESVPLNYSSVIKLR